MSNDNRYNGWTNYETWRVNLEYFDGDDYWRERAEELAKEAIENEDGFDASYIARTLREEMGESVANYIEETCSNGESLVSGWAVSFVDNVNFREIAEHVVEQLDVWSAGWNMPGYLPDSEPGVAFTDWDEARDYLIEELDRAIDEASSEEQEGEEGEDVAEYEAAKEFLLTNEGIANTECGVNAGRYFWFISRMQ